MILKNSQFDYWDRNIKYKSKKKSIMLQRSGFVVMVLLLITSSTIVSAGEQMPIATNGDYIIQPINDAEKNTGDVRWVYDTITQGMIHWHQRTVSSHITSLNMDLNWDNPSNSLRLKIYSPDGHLFGPFYDGFDGAYDGRINLNIINSAGIAKGTWYCEVYGEQVEGTQSYYI
ncbi:peptidase domain-containing protein [Methanocalculus chunghsingensis]|nr:peptidase domain-containing protein [Methanocalculus chunghsingensis]